MRIIKKINENLYILFAVGGDESLMNQINLIFLHRGEIIKYINIHSIDKTFRDIVYYFDEKNNELIFPRRIENSNDVIDMCDLDVKNNKLLTISPLKIDVKKYKSKFHTKFSYFRDVVFFKIKF